MKKRLFCLLPLACLMFLAACKKSVVFDYPNSYVAIAVKNSAKDNLLARPDFTRGISITYKGENYPLRGATRAAYGPPVFEGLWMSQPGTGYATMRLGEFSVDTKNYRGEAFTINWNDGTKSEVTFDLYATYNGKNERPTIHQATWLDGEVNSANSLVVTIIK